MQGRVEAAPGEEGKSKSARSHWESPSERLSLRKSGALERKVRGKNQEDLVLIQGELFSIRSYK